MYEDIRIYESIVIECFLRLKIHNIATCVPRFDIENLIFIVSMVNYETLAMQCHAEIFILKVLSRLIPACASVLSTIGCCYCFILCC